ncbi:hypothetical protein RJT34_12630 [Clitoria ternatea]|uniref:Uncharacterized protein n=1 Tax=Clitoria ternatea TaxID=43366 RepID=A0AAN9JP99_CLITE
MKVNEGTKVDVNVGVEVAKDGEVNPDVRLGVAKVIDVANGDVRDEGLMMERRKKKDSSVEVRFQDSDDKRIDQEDVANGKVAIKEKVVL